MARIGQVNITKKCMVNGVWKLCPCIIGGNNRLRPDVVLVDGVEEVHTEGRYYIDYLEGKTRKRLAAGKTAAEATMSSQRQRAGRSRHGEAAAAAGIALPEVETKAEAGTGGRSL